MGSGSSRRSTFPRTPSQRYPILLSRTPYSCQPYGEDAYKANLGPSELFGKEGYIVVYQDVRGRWMSEGEFVNMRPHRDSKNGPQDIDESTDTYDTIDWLIKHLPNHNGRVGMWGISYPGFYTAAGMIDAHPALKAASPQAPVTDWFTGDDWHHNGAFFLPHAFNFLASFGHPRPAPTKVSTERFKYGTPDGYAFYLRLGPLSHANQLYFKDDVPFWNEIMQHGTFDEFWQARNLRPHLKGIKPAVMTVGGWFDAENLFGALETYKKVEANSPGATNVLVMGPWRHGGWAGGRGRHARAGAVSFRYGRLLPREYRVPVLPVPLERERIGQLPGGLGLRDRDQSMADLRRLAAPEGQAAIALPPAPRRTGLRAIGRRRRQAFDEYTSDPSHPVEYIDKIEIGMTGDYMIQDQRIAARRPDVLVYSGGDLKEDLTIAGPIQARLFVSTSGTDSDWVVKLIDVYPDDYPRRTPDAAAVKLGGYQQLVRGDVMRGKFRNSLSKPEPFVPGQPTPVNFTLQDVAHTFRAGHKIMVQIQSSWFPIVDRNPQKFVDIYSAKESDFQTATQRVYHSSEMPSHLEVLELPH